MPESYWPVIGRDPASWPPGTQVSRSLFTAVSCQHQTLETVASSIVHFRKFIDVYILFVFHWKDVVSY